MLGGLQGGIGPSMFSNMAMAPNPDPEEMAQEAERALYTKGVTLSKVQVKTYDLNEEKSRKIYLKDLRAIFTGITAKTHLILCRERKFVEAQVGKPKSKPGWIVHMEWMEFTLEIEATPTVPGDQGDTDG